MDNNKFCPSCKYFEKSPDNCGRKNGKYGLCRYGVRQGFRPKIVRYQHPACEEFKDKIEAIKCSDATTLCWYCKHAVPKWDKLTGEQITGCSWSIDRQPVVGWKTHQHRIYKVQKGGTLHSYTVTECPRFAEE